MTTRNEPTLAELLRDDPPADRELELEAELREPRYIASRDADSGVPLWGPL